MGLRKTTRTLVRKMDLRGDPALTLTEFFYGEDRWLVTRFWERSIEHQKGRLERVRLKSTAAAYRLYHQWVEEKAKALAQRRVGT